MSEVTYVYNNGVFVGREVYDPRTGGGACFPPEGEARLGYSGRVDSAPAPEYYTEQIQLSTVSGRIAAETSWFDRAFDYVAGIFSFASPTVTACDNGTMTVEDYLDDGGIPLEPGDVDTDAECSETGLCEGVDGGIVLPEENGDPVMPEDAFAEISGSGSHFQESPEVNLEVNIPGGSNLQNLDLVLQIGVNSTRLDYDGLPGPDMPADGCFDGLIRFNQLSAEDIENEVPGCPEEGYETFVSCPSDPGNRLPLYLAGYEIEAYDYVGGEEVFIGGKSETLTNVEELFLDTSAGQMVPTACGSTPSFYNVILEQAWHASGGLHLSVRPRFITDARQYVPPCNVESPDCTDYSYKAVMHFRIREAE